VAKYNLRVVDGAPVFDCMRVDYDWVEFMCPICLAWHRGPLLEGQRRMASGLEAGVFCQCWKEIGYYYQVRSEQ